MKKILIVEDDRTTALALSIRLNLEGYATWIAHDAVAGLNLAITQKPDLVIMDVELPEGDGFTLAHEIHGLPESHNIPILFATASRDPVLRNKALGLGAAGLLRKPNDLETLISVVRYALNTSSP